MQIVTEVENIMRDGIDKYAKILSVNKSKIELLLGLQSKEKVISTLVLVKNNFKNGELQSVKLSSLLGMKVIFLPKVNGFIVNALRNFARNEDITLAEVYVAITINVNDKLIFWLQNGTSKQVRPIAIEELINED